MTNKDFLGELSQIFNDPEFDNIINNKNRAESKMKKKLILVIVIAVIALPGVAAAAISANNVLKDKPYYDKGELNPLTIKPYYDKGELENMLEAGELSSDFLLENVPDDLTPIDPDRFMFYVPQVKGIIVNTSYQPHTLDAFNDVFGIEYIKQIGDNRAAVVYKLGLQDDFIFAVVVFKSKEVDFSDDIIDPGVYDLWLYLGECYFYSSELTSFVNNKPEKGMLFQELENEIAGISHIFRLEYNEKTNRWNWIAIVLTENGAKKIVFGLDKAADVIYRSDINDSRLIEVISEDCK